VDSGTGRTAKTVTAFGDAAYSTLQQKFGTGSMRFDGTGDYFTVASNIDFAYGTSDFTIEMWVYRQGTGVQILFDQRTSSATTYAPVLFINTTNQLAYTDGEGATKITGTTTVPLNTWSHVTVSRSGTSTKIFLNGSQEGSTYSDSRNYIQTPVRIGARWDATGGFNGHIDELRISKGLARYTANFTAPTAAFTNDSNTVLLLHADSTPIVDDPGVTAVNADIDLNSRLNLTAGTGITLVLDPTTDTLTIAATGGSAGEFEDIYVDDSIIGPEYVDNSGVQPILTIQSSQHIGLSGVDSKIRLLGSVSGGDSGVKSASVIIDVALETSTNDGLSTPSLESIRFEHSQTSFPHNLVVSGNITTTGGSNGNITAAGNLSVGDLFIFQSGYPTGTPSNTATPAGYLLVEIAGSNRYIPYYQ